MYILKTLSLIVNSALVRMKRSKMQVMQSTYTLPEARMIEGQSQNRLSMGTVGGAVGPQPGPDRPGVEWRIGEDLEAFLEARRGRRTTK